MTKENNYEDFDTEITFKFPNRELAADFKAAMCDGGGWDQCWMFWEEEHPGQYVGADWWSGAIIEVTVGGDE